jgi:pimeloyl-ACP methyl ester carboxylesterase
VTVSEINPDALVADHAVPTTHGRVHVFDRPGEDPAFVLMHGFPDDARIYDRLAPLLWPRRVVSFDFVGYGRSARADPGQFRSSHHEGELGAVLDALELEHVIVVGHDASGPVAIDYALSEPHRVRRVVLLNTYYGHAPLRLPEMIRLFADPDFAPLADAMVDDPNQRLWLLWHTARRFGLDPLDPTGIGVTSIAPQFFGDTETPDALPAIRAWTGALFAALDRQDDNIKAGRLAGLDVPVSLVFGAQDEYLNTDLAHHLAGLFTHGDLHLVEDASHWPQWDQPEFVAHFMREVATDESGANASCKADGGHPGETLHGLAARGLAGNLARRTPRTPTSSTQRRRPSD